MSLPKALTALPWRVLVPVALVIGLGMTMWGGIHMIASATARWQQDLQSYAQERVLEFSTDWHEVTGELGAYNTFSGASEQTLRTQFARISHHLVENNTAIKSLLFLPAPLAKQEGQKQTSLAPFMAFPNVLEKDLKRTNFEQQAIRHLPNVSVGLPKDTAKILDLKAHKVLLPYMTETRGRTILLAVPVTSPTNSGWFLAAVDVPQLIAGAMAEEHIIIDQAGLSLKLQDSTGQALVDGVLYARKKTGFRQLAFDYVYLSNWGGAVWEFNWRFDAASAGGPKWYAGILLICLGLLMTVSVG